MKKIIFLFSILYMALFMLNIEAKAHTLTKKFANYYYERNNPEGTNYYHGTLKEFLIDDKTAYCLEPGVPTGTDQYKAGKWKDTSIPEAMQKDLALYAYYGYDYPGHQTTNYRAATQALIWERVLADGSVVTFSTGDKGSGEAIDVSKEKQEILNLVKKHNVKPSFDQITSHTYFGWSTEMHDSFKVLEDFEIVDDGGAKIERFSDYLRVYPQKSGKTTIKLKKKAKYDSDYQIFYSDDYQDLIVAGEGYPVESVTYAMATAGRITVKKIDADNLTNVAQGEGTLQGAVFGIYDDKDKLIEKVTTDKNGKASGKVDLAMARYTVKEITPSRGYELDKTVYNVNVNTAKEYEIEVKEKIIKRGFHFIKVINYNETGEMVPEIQVEFAIFDMNNHKLFSKITNLEGKIDFELPYGHYILKQLTVNDKYEKLPDYYFNVLESGEETKVFADEGITARVKIVKIDGETLKNIPLAHVKFKIYDVANQEYVKQKISYPYQEEVSIFETDDNGIIITPLPVKPGQYILEEVADKYPGYLWNSEKIEFTIDKNADFEDTEYGKIITINFPNYPVKGEIEIIKKGTYLTYHNGEIKENTTFLENVEFGLYASADIFDMAGNLIYQKDKLITSLMTNNEGIIKISDLPLGKYYVKELKTIDGYVLNTQKYEIELKYQDEYTPVVKESVTIENRAYQGMLNLLKIAGDTKKPMRDVLFAIYDEFDNLVYEGKTNDLGQINLDLPLGKYYIKELKTLDGYVLNSQKYAFALQYQDEYTPVVKESVTIENTPCRGMLNIVKIASDTKKPMRGVLFAVYDELDNLVYEGKTNALGQINLELPLGKYYIKELKTLDGYVLNSQKYEIELKYQDEYTPVVKESVTIENTLCRGMLNLLKIASDTKKPMNGVLFAIYDEFDNLVYEGKTNALGQINLDLPLGKYYLLEKKTLKGYELNMEKIYFELTKEKNVFSYKMVNNPEKIIVEVPDTYLDKPDFSLLFVPLIGIIIYAKKKKIFI